MTDLVDLVYEQIQDAEQRKAAIDVEIEALNEIHEIARTKLNGDAPASQPARPRAAKKTSTRRSPAPPREDNGTVSRAQAPAGGGRSQTSSRRAPAAPQGPASAGGGRGRGGRQSRHDYSAETVIAKAREVFAAAKDPVTASEVARLAGYPDKNDRSIAAMRHAILDLIGESFIVEAGNGRGGHPRYVLAPAAPSDDEASGSDFLSVRDRIVVELETDGGRVARADLRTRCGSPEFGDFEEALNSLLTDKRITRVQAGGVAGYELA